jgi:exosortase
MGTSEMITTDSNGALVASSASGTPPTDWEQRQSSAWWWAAGAVTLVLALAYAPNFRELFRSWSDDPNYSHGFLVIPIALFMLWRRLSDKPWERSRDEVQVSWRSWAVLAIVLAVRFAAYEEGFQWVETATLLPAIVCLTWTFGGGPLLRRTWPAILFLVFMLPLPNSVNGLISLPLQRIAATGSYLILQMSGFWAVQQGNIINLKIGNVMEPLDVALACNGLKMLMTLAATVTATVLLLPLPLWKRITLLLSAVPIAMISNIIRIVTTGWCYYYIKGAHAKEWAHDISGLLMMPLALILVGLELQLLSWLALERTEDEEDDRKLIFPALLGAKASGEKTRKDADLDELA